MMFLPNYRLKMLLLLLLFELISNARSTFSGCDVCYEEICYEKNRIFTNFQLTSQLAIDRANNILYFSFENDKKHHFNAVYDLNQIRMYFLDMRSGFGKAVDQRTGNVYISSASGNSISIYNHKSETTITLKIKKHVNFLQFFRNCLYLVEENKTSIMKYESNGIAKLHIGLINYYINDFVIDKNNDIFFVSNSTLYRNLRNEGEPTIIDNKTYSLSVDKDYNAIFLDTEERKLYKMDYANNKVKPVGGIFSGFPLSLAFDGFNNPIYYDFYDKSLYSLSPNFSRCQILNDKDRIRLKRPFRECKPPNLCPRLMKLL